MRFGSDSELEWEPLNGGLARRLALRLGASQPKVVVETEDSIFFAQEGFSKETWAELSDEERTLLAEFDPTKDK